MSFLFKWKRDANNDNHNKTTAVKCKECTMTFLDKERLDIHKKKAHSGKGERKKNNNTMH
jgi:hypothetical protein